MPDSSSPFARIGWIDPEAVFVHLFANASRAFWLDAGTDAETGWSWMGTGTPVAPDAPFAVVAARADGGDDGAEHHASDDGAFRGGWVGWRTYEGADAWMRVDALVAFDHGSRRVLVFGDADLAARVAAAPAAPAVTSATARARHPPASHPTGTPSSSRSAATASGTATPTSSVSPPVSP